MKKLTLLPLLTLVLALTLLTAGSASAAVTVTAASGGGSISADTAVNAASPAWTTLGAITITEGADGDFAVGTNVTLILMAPAGFQFNTAVTPSITFTAGRNITSAAIAVSSSTNLTITLTVSGINAADTLTIGSTTGIQVQPTAGTPLATSLNIYRPSSGGGTATITGITTSTNGSSGSNFGTLGEVSGLATHLTFTTQPGGATAGAAFTTQPVVNSQDQFGNNSTNGLTATNNITVSLTSGTGPLQGTTTLNIGIGTGGGKGTATYSGLLIDVEGTNDQLTATSTNGLASATSSVFTVNPAAASKLVMGTQPSATATAGVAFAQQPVILIEDQYNNVRSNDTLTVTATRSAGAGTLLGTTNVAAIGGVTTYTNLAQPLATNITIAFSSGALTAVTSSVVAVSPGSYSQLQVLMPGETAAPGTTTGKTGTPTAQTAGTALTVTVNAVDANWNVVSTNDTVAITSSDANATLPANAALSAGTQTFSVTFKTAGTQTVTATDVTNAGITSNIGTSTTVNAGTENKLQLLMPGETAAPGTATGKTGSPTAQTAGTGYTVTVNAVDANWNVISTNDTVAISSSDTNATLPANAALVAGTKTLSLTNKTAGVQTVTASDTTHTAITANTGTATTVNPGAFVKLQTLAPGETAAPGSATGKTGTPTAQNTDNSFNVTVNAVDAYWNLISTNDTVAITSTDPNATLPANAALSGGTGTFNVNFNTAGTQTVTASDVSNGAITNGTSGSITVNAGAFVKLQLLMPGETAAPGTSTGKTGTPTAQTAGTALTVTVHAVDANWNVVSTNDTVAITSSDANAVLPANAALSAGTKTFSVTFKTAGVQTVTASDATHPAITASTGTATTVNPAAASKLVMGTQPSATATAGVAFAQQPVILIEDQYNNVRSNDTLTVTATRSAGAGTLLGTTNVAAIGGVTTYTNLAQPLATNITIAFSSGALTAVTSSVVAVSPGSYSQLQVLMPGETAAPGTTTGMTGTPTAQTAGTALTVTVNAVDANWNVVSTNDTVAITSSDANATLPANAALSAGTQTFSVTFKTAGAQTVTASDVTNAGITSNIGTSTTVNAGTENKLQLLMPGETAAPGTATGKTGSPTAQTAGTGYTVTVNAVDANWNVISTNDTVAISSSDTNATLPANAALVAGTKTLSLTNKTAGVQTVTASDTTHTAITANTGTATTVNPGAFVKLQTLAPGETAAPGSATGKTGTPTAQNTDNSFNVTVNAVDAYWNLISTNDTVAITSTDPNATLPANAALSGGTGTFNVNFNTAGTQTVTASDVSNGAITNGTSGSITVNAGAFVKLQLLMPGETAAPGTSTGKTGTPTAQTAGTALTVTVHAVDANWNVVSTNDTVAITSSDANAVLPANAALSAGTKTFSVTFKTAGVQTVTASDATHPAITASTGTATTVNPAAASKLVMGTQPSATATAGVAFAQQPVILIEDQYNNVRSNDTLTVTATRSAGAGTLLGTTNVAAIGGVTTYTNLAQPLATNITIAFSSGALTAVTSSVVAVSPGSYSQLQVLMPGETAAPGTTTGKTGTPTAQTAGTALSVTVHAVDANWNPLTNVTDTVAITSSDANATLPANAALSAGTQTFSVMFKTAGAQTVTASDVTNAGITSNIGTSTTVNAGTENKLQLLMPGETAAPGTATGKTGSPTAQTAGTGYTVTVNAVDANWNVISTNDTVAISSSDTNATLPANAALVAGTKTLSLTNKTAGVQTVTASDTTHTAITANTGTATTVNPGAFVKLQTLAPGETAAPGSATGKTGTPTAQNTDNSFNVTVNAVDANWNLVNTVGDTVAITSTDPNATLPANAALSGGTGTFNVNFNTAGTQTVTASDVSNGAITNGTSGSITVNAAAFVKLQLLMPGETAAPGTSTGKTGTPTAQTAGTALTVTVHAVDANWNVVSTNDTVAITSSDANAVLPANAALSAGTKTFSVTFKTAGVQTVTASDATHPAITASTGTATTVNAGLYNKLQVLMPGETAAPGTTTGKTGTPTAQTAGTALNVTVNAVDANWNVVSTNDTVHITSSDANAVLPANAALSAGTQTFSVTFLTAGSQTVTASNITHTAITANTGTATTVSAAAFAKLQLLMPGETAAPGTTTGMTGTPTAQTAGTALTVTVNAVDANWNVVSTNDTVAITSSDANATLPANAALSAGTQTFSVTFKTAGAQTVTASDVTNAGITSNIGTSTTVNAGTENKLQLLMPGETAAPGTATGKTGSPTAQTAGTGYTVTVNAVDANWNVISTNDTVAISSSDTNATLPANAALVAGTKTLSLTNKTAGVQTVTASDTTHTAITANTGTATTVNPGAFVKLQTLAPGETAAPGSATGKTGTPTAQNTDNSFNVTVNAVDAYWNLISTNDTVAITSTDPNATLPANAALSGGTGTFNVNFNTAGTQTVTASDVSNGAITNGTSGSITVNAGAFVKLQLLMPGETAAPGTSTGKTGTPTAQTAGTALTVTVHAVDANWNVVSTNDTVAITSSDANAVLPANAALSAGTKTFSVTFKTAGVQTVTASDATHPAITASTGTATTVNPAAASKLVMGTQPSATATAGVAFAQQPVILIEDQYNNVRSNDTLTVTATRSAGAGTLLGTTNVAAIGGVTTYTNLAQPLATNITIAFSSGALTAVTSSVVAVSPGSYSQLQVLMPGETAAPGTTTGKTGTPTAQTAGTALSVTVHAVDANWNPLTNVTDTVAITSSDANATLPANAALSAGTQTFSVMFKTAGAQTVTASDVTNAGITSNIGTSTTVNAGTENKLQLLMPGETAAPGTATGKTGSPTAQTAGTGYTVTVNAVDANWNVISTNDTVAISSSDTNATLPANAALVAGTKTLSLTNKTAGVQTVTASDTTHTAITANTGTATTVNPGAFVKLQTLAPGETAAPGSATGKTGTPTAQNTDNSFNVTVNAVDANWNLVNTVGDTVAITSTDPNATLPANAALSGGTGTFNVNFNTAGTQTVTASDVSNGAITNGTSGSITVNAAAFVKLQLLMPGETAAPGTSTGKTGTPTAQTAGTALTVTVHAVDANWNVVSTNDTVAITSSDANAVLPANAALSAGTKTFSVTFKTAGVQTVTASDATHPAITASTGTATTVNAGLYNKLQVLMPGETAAPGTTTGKTGTPTAQTAGTALNVTVNAVDANWNVVSTNDTVHITSSDANAVLPANAALSAGTQTFSVTFLTAGSQTVTASNITHTAITANTGTATTVSAAAFAKLQLLMPGETAAPGTTTGKTGTPTAQTAGTALSVTVHAVDANWNPLTNVTDTVAITSSDANATLPANAALSAGTQTFSVMFKTAGAQTVTASDVTNAGITSNIGTSTTVNAGTENKLQLLMPGETAAPGTATGKTGSPTAQTAGTGYTVTVNAVDANWNVISTNDTVAISSSDTNATLPANAALVAGTKTLSLTNKTAGVQTVTASDTTHTAITANTGTATTVNPGAFVKLQTLAPGETAAPGSATGKTGTPTAQNTDNSFNVTVNAVDANWNLVNTVGDTVAITSTDPNATLPANAALSGGTGTFNVNFNTAGTQTVTASDVSNGAITNGTSGSITVNAAAFVKLQLLMPGETAAPGTSTGKTGTPTAQTAGTALTVTVHAVDANWNVVSTNDTVAITSSDANAVLPANAALSAGTKTFSVTFKTAGVQTVTASDATHPAITASTGTATTVNAGLYNKLQVLMPGETAAPGTTTGKTGTPTAQTAGTALNVTVNAVDANWNVVSTNDTVHITSSDANAVLPANAALSAGTQTFSVTFLTAGSQTVTASNITHTAITANTGTATTVSAAAFAKLQLLMPGETAAPGTTTGMTGTPTAQTAGTALTVTVNAVDANWNVVSTNDTVAITSSDANATLPANAALSAGTQTFSVTFKTAGTQTVTATDVTNPGNTPNTGTATTVNPAAASKLVIGTQPSATATAGVAFAQQPVIFIEDQYNNLRSSDTLTVTATCSAGAGTLLGTTNMAAIGGVTTYTNLAQPLATNITIAFSSGDLTAVTSSVVVVSPGSYSQLQVLMPGETAAPGTTTGKTGTPTAQTVSTAFNVTVNAVDTNWNVISTNDTVAITSSDTNATLPSNAALVAGTQTFSVTFLTAGSQTVTASNVTDTAIMANTGTATTVNMGSQTITFGALADVTNGIAPFGLSATASSGLPVSFSIVSGPATISGTNLTVNGVGTVTVQASQAGNANWNAAPGVQQSFNVAPSGIPEVPYTSEVASDNFDRPNGSLGTDWAEPIASQGNLVITNDMVGVDTQNAHCLAYWAADSFSNDQYSQATLTSIGPWTGVILRADSSVDEFYLGFVFGPNDYRIYFRYEGTYYSLATGSNVTWQVGDVLRLEISGSNNPVTVTMYQNGTPVLMWRSTTGDVVKNNGSPGMGIYSPSGDNLTLGDWEGGNLDPDTNAPTVPANLTANAVSPVQINLNWTASTDDVGVAGYLVERSQGAGSTNYILIATPTGTNYSDTGLTANTTYNYKLMATDAAGNLSECTEVVTATTPIPNPPTISVISNQTTLVGISVGPFPFTISDPPIDPSTLTVTATSSNTNLVPDQNLVIANLGSTQALVATPAAGQTGTSTITVTVSNGVNSTNESFLLTVNPPSGATGIFANPTNIVIPSLGAATPYPSTIEVSGEVGPITNLEVTLNSMSDVNPSAVNALLVGPDGQAVVLMSDTVGDNPMTNITFTLSDQAFYPLPNNSPMADGTFQATDYAPNNTNAPYSFGSPAPAPPYSASLGGAFDGLSPNGTWSLYVYDGGPDEGGEISGGWSLAITTLLPPTISGLTNQTTVVNTPSAAIPFEIGDAQTPASNLVLTAISSDAAVVAVSGIVFTNSDDTFTNQTITLTPQPNVIGATTISVIVTDGDGLSATNSFLMTVNQGQLTVGGITASNKTYDGTVSAALNVSTASLEGEGLSGSDVTLNTSGVGGTFVDGNVGTNKTVQIAGLVLNGADAGNYILTQPTTMANITPAPLTVTANNDSKTYDGVAYSGGNGVSYTGFVNGENSNVLGGTLSYTGASQGAINAGNYAITPGGLTSGNYAISFQSGTLTINQATPTLTAPMAGAITYGQTLANSTLSGGAATNALNNAAVGGSFAFTTPSTAPGAGTASQSVTFTPTDTTDYNSATVNVPVTVNQQTPTLTAPMATAITYGQTLTNSILNDGAATNAANNAAVGGSFAFTTPSTTPDAGTPGESVTFTPTDTTDYSSATINVPVTVNQQTPTLTAPTSTAITYGQTLTNSILNGGAATNALNSAAVAGSFAFTTPSTAPGTGTTNSESVTFSPTDTTDYSSTTVNVDVTVNQAGTFLGLTSSTNPCGFNTSVSFTASGLPTNATGNVVFLTNSVTFDTEGLSSGSATSAATTLLPPGTNLITAEYAGDSNYLGSTNTLNQVVTEPLATPMTVQRTAGTQLLIALSDLATNWSDAVSGTTVELTGIGPVTTNNVTLMLLNVTTNLDGSYVITNDAYIGYTNSPNVNDQFTYSLTDQYGATNIGIVNIVIVTNVTGTSSIASITHGNPTTLTAYGKPGYVYITQRATNLVSPVWVNISTNTAATNSLISVTDNFSDLGGQQPASAYYRLSWSPLP